ncbi:MAG: helix-turn-helix transcriptional regulator [Lachnospiraceae bacterium]|nr:helix-turn-helix transcriptional regulator [Lachnospiraceae bacterium]
MELSEKIKNARIAKNMSQRELAQAIGVSDRTIQNYEMGARMPRNRDTYEALAKALSVNVETLLDDNASFVLSAKEQYGARGAKQAMDMVNDIAAMWAGGEMEEDDMDAIMQAMQEAYWEAKKNNRKYVNKRFLDENDTGSN